MNDAFLSDPRITSAVDPDVLTFLRENLPPADADAETQIGHWMGVTATVLAKVSELSQELAQSRQRVRELEADV
ncbi:hypothetical protein [Arthrobacter sp. 4R501]|uniref:hypothetical protein n=1 Tax=Arthrobacter sp. 4R501 TaxID=2058886 RepID=UPI000CE4B394|nr:hypothetical protein [Arthrobacter sp. 4R501]